MKIILAGAIAISIAAPAFAQQVQPTDPKTEATERMLLDEMTAHRNWYATAIAKDAALQQSQQKLNEAQMQIVAQQKIIDAAKETAASAKAVPPPPAQ